MTRMGDQVTRMETTLQASQGRLHYRCPDLAQAEEKVRELKDLGVADPQKRGTGVSLTFGASQPQGEDYQEWWDLVIDLGPTPKQQEHDLVAFGRIELLRQALGAYRSALLSGEKESQEMRDLAKEALE